MALRPVQVVITGACMVVQYVHTGCVRLHMSKRFTVTVTDDQADWVEELADSDEYDSKSGVVRDLLHQAQEVEELRTEAERLRNQRDQLIEDRTEKKELAKYAETSRDLEEQRLRASVVDRARWWLFGFDGDDQE